MGGGGVEGYIVARVCIRWGSDPVGMGVGVSIGGGADLELNVTVLPLPTGYYWEHAEVQQKQVKGKGMTITQLLARAPGSSAACGANCNWLQA